VVSLSLKDPASWWSPCHSNTQLHGGLPVTQIKHPASWWSPCHSKAQLHGGRLRRTAINLLIVWLAAVIYSARILFELLSSGKKDFDLEVGEEHDEDDDDDNDETCTLFIETDLDDIALRGVDLCLLYVIPIAIQIFCYVRVAQKLWSSQVCILKILQPRIGK